MTKGEGLDLVRMLTRLDASQALAVGETCVVFARAITHVSTQQERVSDDSWVVTIATCDGARFFAYESGDIGVRE
jgi:hypothetical protein